MRRSGVELVKEEMLEAMQRVKAKSMNRGDAVAIAQCGRVYMEGVKCQLVAQRMGEDSMGRLDVLPSPEE